MRDSSGKVLYVGKAKDLKNRVDSYFSGPSDSPKTAMLVQRVAAVEFLAVHSESEALVLEHNFVKQFQPPYNILLKEGVPYAYAKITGELFPRLLTVRSTEARKGERVFGPYLFGLTGGLGSCACCRRPSVCACAPRCQRSGACSTTWATVPPRARASSAARIT